MNIQILSDAQTDLLNGFYFYENQQIGLGDYFYDSVLPILIRLSYLQGFINKLMVFIKN